MPNEPVLVDTGPLLALYSSEDTYHERCVEQMDLLPVGKAFTCWPVLTEAAYMLRNRTQQRDDLLQSVINGDLVLLGETEQRYQIRHSMTLCLSGTQSRQDTLKYLADARMRAELNGFRSILVVSSSSSTFPSRALNSWSSSRD